MMRVSDERREELKAHALRRIQESRENDARKGLLAGFVGRRLKLAPAQQREFERLLDTEPYRGAKNMITPWEERGVVRGERTILERQLQRRFGPLKPEIRERLARLPAERLEELADAILDAKSLKELGLDD
jgi:hypothetical protein